MLPYFHQHIGNASSIHRCGVEASKGVERARSIIAQYLNAEPEEIVFTSGGTESNNHALKGVAFANADKGRHIIVSEIEHPSVLNVCRWLEGMGFEITRLPVDSEGFVSVDELRRTIRSDTILVSISQGNNEIGTVQPVGELGQLCAEMDVYFHTDACQSFTRQPLDVKTQKLDLITINAHKIHGPKGVGALYITKGIRIQPLLDGGGQERGIRSGTHNTPGIVGLGEAVRIADKKDVHKIASLRDYAIQLTREKVPGARPNGSHRRRLCHSINLSFSGVNGKELLLELDRRGIIVSSGSACSSTSLRPSYVLMAIGLSKQQALSSIRIGLSKWTTKEELETAVENIAEVVSSLRTVGV